MEISKGIKRLVKKFIPSFLLNLYHYLLPMAAAFFYRFPSRDLIVIGVTGTQGKSTTVNLIGKILEEAGFKVSWISSLSLKIGREETLNPYHMTMPGRFFTQRFLRRAVEQGCQYGLIEVTSEGILQYRHRFIDFDLALFTNLAPEHIERHGSFKDYREAKIKLFKSLSKTRQKLINNKKIKKTIIVNLDDKNAEHFLKFLVDERWGYKIKSKACPVSSEQREDWCGVRGPKSNVQSGGIRILEAKDCQVLPGGVEFSVGNVEFNLNLLGEFNIYNALAAICVVLSQGIDLETCKKALEKIEGIPGRMEEILEGQRFRVFVDLAHTPGSFKQVFEFTKVLASERIISVFGVAGGGRDKWKRTQLGKVAAEYCDFIVLCNEDPYDEDPAEIINNIEKGVRDSGFEMRNCFKVEDRRGAIRKGLSLAQENDVVLILGKGTEQTMVIAEKTFKWDDREVVSKELKKILKT